MQFCSLVGQGAAAGEGGGEGPWEQEGKGRVRQVREGGAAAKERRRRGFVGGGAAMKGSHGTGGLRPGKAIQ